MKPNRAAAKQFAILHLTLLGCAALFFLMASLGRALSGIFSGCILHDLFHIYCGFCGGTRTVEALLRLDFSEAIRCNPFVVATFGVALALYILAWIRFLRGKEILLRIPDWGWIAWTVALCVYCLLRNILLIAFGIDPLGDLLPFWNGI